MGKAQLPGHRHGRDRGRAGDKHHDEGETQRAPQWQMRRRSCGTGRGCVAHPPRREESIDCARGAGTLSLIGVPDPTPAPGDLVVDAMALGVCGTYKGIAAGSYYWARPSEERPVIGQESLVRVREAPVSSGFSGGDLVVRAARRPDPKTSALETCTPGGVTAARAQGAAWSLRSP